MRLVILILLMVLSLTPARARGEAYIVRVLPSRDDIAISGPITRGLGEAFRAALESAPKARLVRLESRGGTFDVAIELFLAIRARGLDTAVQGFCASACTVAFMAGKRRYAAPRARLGFHSAAAADTARFASIPMADFMVRGFYLQSGMAEWFADRVMSTPHAEMWQPSLDEMRRGAVITDVGIPP